ncbi:D-sorbitol dehydrogenase (acceptor) [Serratia fonticola]|uniref:D-sorbitol dehydrogenase (Acceptor) n=1 Tax=Serratia fonticola TaxID=47917 RepID=A0A542BRG8_SERFO|nr:c-type cytochrome [Serratia fonticola]TQI81172.1 D-sorbitol dehydrogenase (acceptor) [Serratia fonticola]TQI96804.1 D-sorbitol dehydrogenase (acceptor) [Serratia fonticola]TVZ71300.1 D-sorbitol dehydrogenase (acceptor) [Serratia fonticola]
MKILLRFFVATVLLTGLSDSFSAFAAEEINDKALIERGRYIAVAADCGACHRQASNNGIPFAGGYAIESPMGRIIASNITPSKQYGIGNYSEQQFANAVREGKAADGHNLYPAMPYTSYHDMTAEDIHALYAYFIYGVKPADFAPSAQTDLSFPFNIRQVMWGWNQLYLGNAPVEESKVLPGTLKRGKYLVEVLAHCGACHTPRNIMMAEKRSLNLSGSPLGGWYAPNITPDKSGIGDWSQHDLVTYLKTGHLAGKAQAAGAMAEAVENSFSLMTDDDLNAIAAWVKQAPAIATTAPKIVAQSPRAVVDINLIITGEGDTTDSSTTDGAKLYESACASCHGHEGQGTEDNFYPSLTHNRAVAAWGAQNVIMTIAYGIQRKSSDGNVSMPAFSDQLNNAQIASVSNYVRSRFAGIEDQSSALDVQVLRDGGTPPFIMQYINGLIAAGTLVIAVLLGGIFWYWRKVSRA